MKLNKFRNRIKVTLHLLREQDLNWFEEIKRHKKQNNVKKSTQGQVLIKLNKLKQKIQGFKLRS
jgi:hypothetical protein